MPQPGNMSQHGPPGRARRWVIRRLTRAGIRPRHAAYAIVSFWLLAVIIFGVIERLSDPHTFPTVWLAFWWAIETVTTVGYGDVVPRQTTGKVMAAFLMLGGLSMLSILTATITSAFVARRQEQIRAARVDPVETKLDEIGTRLGTIESELQQLRAASSTPRNAPSA